MRHHTKFCADGSNRCGDMAVYNFSRWRPSAILDFQKFVNLTACTLRGAKTRHHAKFCADGSNRCRDMAVFDFSRWRPSAILDLKKLEILTAHTLLRVKMRHRTEFCADRSRRCAEIWLFSIFQGVCLVCFLYACLDHPRSVFWWSLSLCKIWFESVQ